MGYLDLDLDTQVVDEPTWKNYGMKIPYSGNSSLSSFEGIGEIFSGLASIFNVIGGTLSDGLKEAMAVQASDTATRAFPRSYGRVYGCALSAYVL